jgi:hypothetical protein
MIEFGVNSWLIPFGADLAVCYFDPTDAWFLDGFLDKGPNGSASLFL